MFKQDDLYRSVTDDFSRSNRTNLDENYHILLSGTERLVQDADDL